VYTTRLLVDRRLLRWIIYTVRNRAVITRICRIVTGLDKTHVLHKYFISVCVCVVYYNTRERKNYYFVPSGRNYLEKLIPVKTQVYTRCLYYRRPAANLFELFKYLMAPIHSFTATVTRVECAQFISIAHRSYTIHVYILCII